MAADLVERGAASKAEAARRFGLTRWAVGLACKSRGLPMGQTDLGKEVIRLRNLTDEGRRSLAEARRRYAKRYRKAMGYPEPSRLLRLYEKGRGSYSDIAAQFNMTRNQVAGFINRARKEAAV
jgi:transposase-like protein